MRQLVKALIPASARASLKAAILGDRDGASDVAGQIKGRLPAELVQIIFDVGANVGQSVIAYGKAFPSAHIYAFEPDPYTFLELKRNVSASGARVFNYGLGAENSHVLFDTSVPSDRRRVLSDSAAPSSAPSVELRRADDVLPGLDLARIDYLKIDTEGHDLEVLRGAKSLLSEEKINIIEAECSVNCDNTHHASLWVITEMLEGYGYRLFHLFEQAQEWPTRRPNLRRVNAVFTSRNVIERNCW